eukprot:756725-Hanusia_phi.AAC.1
MIFSKETRKHNWAFSRVEYRCTAVSSSYVQGFSLRLVAETTLTHLEPLLSVVPELPARAFLFQSG